MNKLKLLPIIAASALAVMFLFGCGKTSEEDTTGCRDSLYHDVLELTQLYADSLSHASDTVTAESLLAHWESKLQTIYMHYPPASDRLLTEGQNDTIFQLTERLVKSYRRALSPCDSIAADSIASDSIPVTPAKKKS